MLKKYQEEHTVKNIQFILTDFDGVILDSDQAIFHVQPKDYLVSIHPFFESFSSLKDALDNDVIFNCVHLNFNDKEYITDIKFARKKEGFLVVVSDYTSHYTEYQLIAQSRNESIINGELIAIKNAELKERERFKDIFIRNFSHELRNPLTSIISITKLLSDTEMTSHQENMLSFLQDSNSNLKLLLDDILSISMISSGQLKLRDGLFSLKQLTQLIEFTYKTKAKESGVAFTLKVDKKIPEFVEGDRLRLYQTLTNLLDNAFKYTEKGKVHLDVQFNQIRANKISLRFEVIDTGIGISEDNIDSIFESFSQLNIYQNQTSRKGSGLGLSIVKGLLNLMGSEIRVISEVDKGSTFYFDIVLKQPILSKNKPVIVKKGSVKNKINLKEGEKYRLLLVEDDINVQTVLFKFLLSTNYFYIDLINDGSQVMGQLVNEEYDIILMDVNLPSVSGDQVTRLIRDFPFKNIKKIPIIGLTAYSYEDNFKAYKKAGMNAVLSKPFEHDELMATIGKYLKK
ncbi:response regulator [Cellulophaga sp. HaHaR_3_176]|uniref:hybrid sensor histidine kinase/response regulator n=1 Tax=Cellulophaga sp. HaHaR_3_176 TaxID=1942464 RepID=UPI001C1F5CE8|nr:ATP-binding protein [Cellulophaga sp. HaHaR_3_176]QWX83523.1 response regulator [Cellulophaga sp. HaHaR_3_176]